MKPPRPVAVATSGATVTRYGASSGCPARPRRSAPNPSWVDTGPARTPPPARCTCAGTRYRRWARNRGSGEVPGPDAAPSAGCGPVRKPVPLVARRQSPRRPQPVDLVPRRAGRSGSGGSTRSGAPNPSPCGRRLPRVGRSPRRTRRRRRAARRRRAHRSPAPAPGGRRPARRPAPARRRPVRVAGSGRAGRPGQAEKLPVLVVGDGVQPGAQVLPEGLREPVRSRRP